MKRIIPFLIISLLIATPVLGACEDFTTYTVVQVGTRFTITEPKIDVNAVTRDEDSYVYKDFTADYFDALDINYEIFINGTSTLYCIFGPALTNIVDERSGWGATEIQAGYMYTEPNTTFYLNRGNGAAEDSYAGADKDTLFYPTLGRAAGNDTVTLEIYSDAGRQTLEDTLSVSGYSTTKYRYLFGGVSYSSNEADRIFAGYVQNMDLNEAAPEVPDEDIPGIIIFN